MTKKTVLKKGYTIEVTSWENDGDNYMTESIVVQDKEKAQAIAKMCKVLFASKNSSKEGIGNYSDAPGHIKEANTKILSYMKKNPILYDNKKLSDQKIIEACMSINENLMGSVEYFYSRVCEKVIITYSSADVSIETIKF